MLSSVALINFARLRLGMQIERFKALSEGTVGGMALVQCVVTLEVPSDHLTLRTRLQQLCIHHVRRMQLASLELTSDGGEILSVMTPTRRCTFAPPTVNLSRCRLLEC